MTVAQQPRHISLMALPAKNPPCALMLESINVAPELVCSTETLYLPASAMSFFTKFNAESLRLVLCVVLPSEIGCYQLKSP